MTKSVNLFKKITSSPKFVFGLVWVVTISLFALGWGRYAMDIKDRVTQIQNATALSPVTTDALQTRLKSSKAKVKVIHLWATWCEPCARELPIYNDAYKQFATPETEFYVISADNQSDKEEVIKFLRDKKIVFSSYLIDGDQNAFIKQLHPTWSGALPATFIFDAVGKLHSMTLGETTLAQLQTKIQSALSPK